MASNATDGTVRAQHWWRIFRRQNVPLPCSIKVSSKRRRWPKCFTRQRPAMNAPGVMGKSTTHAQTSHVIGRPPNWPLHVENPPNEPFMDAGGHWDGPMNACARVAQSRSGRTSHLSCGRTRPRHFARDRDGNDQSCRLGSGWDTSVRHDQKPARRFQLGGQGRRYRGRD